MEVICCLPCSASVPKQKIWWETRITLTFASDGKNLFAASVLSTNILVSIAIWRESDTFPCHNSNHQNSKTEASDITQNKENFYGFILQLTSKKECYRYSELISALNTFNCSLHVEAQATPNVQNIICERKNWPSFNYLLLFQNSINHVFARKKFHVLENEPRIFWRLKSRLLLHRMNLTKSKEEDYFSLMKFKFEKR